MNTMTARELIVALIDAGWSQGGIAEVIGISQPTISYIHRGKQKRLHQLAMERLRQLAISQEENSLAEAKNGRRD